MKVQVFWALFALVCGLMPQVSLAVDGPCTAGCISQDGCGAGLCDCGRAWSAYAGAELAILEPHLGSVGVIGGTSLPEFDACPSPRFWFGFENGDGLGMRATYWQIDRGIFVTNAAVAPFPGDNYLGVEAKAFDLDTTQSGSLGTLEFQLAAGVRYGRLETNVAHAVASVLNRSLDFEGVGPTVAATVRRPFGCRGFALMGGVRGAWLYGDVDVLDANLVTPGAGPFRSEDHMLQVTEVRIGLDWTRTLRSGSQIFARAAYEAQSWQLANNSLDNVPITAGIFANTPFSGFGLDVGFVGPTLALGVVY